MSSPAIAAAGLTRPCGRSSRSTTTTHWLSTWLHACSTLSSMRIVGTVSMSRCIVSPDLIGKRRQLGRDVRVDVREVGCGHGKQEALRERHAHVGEALGVRKGLDALGDHPRVDSRGKEPDHLDERHLGLVGGDSLDDGAVKFEDRRPQLENLLQPRIPGTGVVHRDERALGPDRVDGRLEIDPLPRGVLGDLQ